jgi:hypothetical protein
MPGRYNINGGGREGRKTPPADIGEHLKLLPPTGGVWQAQAWRHQDTDPDDGNDEYWFVWVTNNDLGLMIKHRVSEIKPSSGFLWDVLVDAMEHPDAGDPERPDQVLAERGEGWEGLKLPLRSIDVRLAFRKHLTLEDGVPETMNEVYLARKQRRKARG